MLKQNTSQNIFCVKEKRKTTKIIIQAEPRCGLDLKYWQSTISAGVLFLHSLTSGILWVAGNHSGFWLKDYNVQGSRELIPRLLSYFCSARSWHYTDNHLIPTLHLQVFTVSHLRDTVQRNAFFFFFLVYVLCWFVKAYLRMFGIFWLWITGTVFLPVSAPLKPEGLTFFPSLLNLM